MKRGLKLVLLGVSMFMTGLLGVAILVGSAVGTEYTSGTLYYQDIWRLFEVTPVVRGFFILGGIGVLIAVIGVFLKDSE